VILSPQSPFALQPSLLPAETQIDSLSPEAVVLSESSQISPLERKATERFELSAENAERKENHGNDKPSPEMEAEDLGRSSESSLLRESSTKEAEVKAAYPLPYPDSSSGSHIEQPRLNDPYTPSVIFCDALGSYVPLAFDSCDTWEVGSHL
jgi:hypothetical protein